MGSTIYEWGLDPGAPATPVTGAPTAAAVHVTDERIMLALAADGDPRAVDWCDAENRNDWTPSSTNLAIEPGETSPEALIRSLKSGFYVTDLFGQGVNMVTGDYSRGAAGFRIVRGEIAGPVAEITIAGNLLEMFRALTPANDLEFRRAVDVPTLRIDAMTVASA